MFWAIIILIILWLLGFTIIGNGLVHFLLVFALVLLIVRLIQGRKP
ncbi:lmo0937 family membrane protein [Pontibacillus sp. HMF3514]|nr:lmo0937 family membrane protein [Pontibacillus sp. HMF3514]QHE51440.1 lmo0937 family membrane protein [Pontibacillus sp. HMF3514]